MTPTPMSILHFEYDDLGTKQRYAADTRVKPPQFKPGEFDTLGSTRFTVIPVGRMFWAQASDKIDDAGVYLKINKREAMMMAHYMNHELTGVRVRFSPDYVIYPLVTLIQTSTARTIA